MAAYVNRDDIIAGIQKYINNDAVDKHTAHLITDLILFVPTYPAEAKKQEAYSRGFKEGRAEGLKEVRTMAKTFRLFWNSWEDELQ